MIQPRQYQSEAVQKVIAARLEGITRQLISLPTGCGKTIIFGLVAEAFRTKTLILAHREELLYQAEQKIHFVYPDADTGILKAEERNGLNAEICIASIQTATRHTEELAQRGYKLLICDEAHHAVSNSYMKVFQELGFMSGNPEKLLLGVTATPYRGDGLGLGNVFEKKIFERSIMTMMRAGYLCDVRGLRVFTGEDISTVHMQTGDFAVNELSAKIDIPERNALIADTYIKHGEGRHGVVFGVKVSHALNLAEAFKARGVSCEAVYGEMPTEQRQDILSRYARHEVQMLTNCAVLTEGWDVPDTDIIMMARPTKSRGLYVQCAGRGLRLAPGKKNCLLVDFVDIAQKHDLCGAGTLLGKNLPKCREGESFLEAIEREEQEITFTAGHYQTPQIEEFDVFNRLLYSWQRIEENYKLPLMDNNTLWCMWRNGSYLPMVIQPTGDIRRLSDVELPLGYALGVCEDYIRSLGGARYALKDAKWRKEPASDTQITWLQKKGIPYTANISKGEANDLLAPVFNERATEKQLKVIRANNLHEYPEILTKKEATQLIREFKAQEQMERHATYVI